MFILQGLTLSEVETSISASRLDSYRTLISSADTGAALGAYFWNLELSSAFSQILSMLEVSVRNSVHEAAKAHFGKPDWFADALRHAGDAQWPVFLANNPGQQDNYFRPTASTFNKRKRHVNGVQKNLKRWNSAAEGKFNETLYRLQRLSISPIPDQIVASTMFGFWCDLFHPSFESAAQTSIWPHCFSAAFPHTTTLTRHSIEQRLRKVKLFRNRLSHHEPIWKSGAGGTPLTVEATLNTLLDEALELLAAMSSALVTSLHMTGQVDKLRWLSSASTLNAFAATLPPKTGDVRKAKKLLERAVKRTSKTISPTIHPAQSITIEQIGKPVAIITPFD